MNRTQQAIILSIMDWARTSREPISRKIIFDRMKTKGIPESTVKASLSVLMKNGFIRKAVSVRHEATYVLLRRIAIPSESFIDQ